MGNPMSSQTIIGKKVFNANFLYFLLHSDPKWSYKTPPFWEESRVDILCEIFYCERFTEVVMLISGVGVLIFARFTHPYPSRSCIRTIGLTEILGSVSFHA